MPDFFYSCVDCPEHTLALNHNTGDLVDHCDEHDRNFTKSWPMRTSPCRAILEQAEHECPVCGETMSLYWSRKCAYFKCETHGVLQEDGTVCVEKLEGSK